MYVDKNRWIEIVFSRRYVNSSENLLLGKKVPLVLFRNKYSKMNRNRNKYSKMSRNRNKYSKNRHPKMCMLIPRILVWFFVSLT
jgi:hypothetical protein